MGIQKGRVSALPNSFLGREGYRTETEEKLGKVSGSLLKRA